MRPRIYSAIDVSSCNADTTGGKTAALVMGPMNIGEMAGYEVTFCTDAAAGSAATSTIAAYLQMAPTKDGPWYTRVNGDVASGSCSNWHDINNQVGWLRVLASSTSVFTHGGLRMIISSIAERG